MFRGGLEPYPVTNPLALRQRRRSRLRGADRSFEPDAAPAHPDPQPPRAPADRIEPHVQRHLAAGIVDVTGDSTGRVIEVRVADVPLSPAPHQWRLSTVPAA